MAGRRQRREGPLTGPRLVGRRRAIKTISIGHRLDPPTEREAPCGADCNWARRGVGGMTHRLPRTSV
jgi:hypothetical protein